MVWEIYWCNFVSYFTSSQKWSKNYWKTSIDERNWTCLGCVGRKNIKQAAIDCAKAAGSNLLQQAVSPKRNVQ